MKLKLISESNPLLKVTINISEDDISIDSSNINPIIQKMNQKPISTPVIFLNDLQKKTVSLANWVRFGLLSSHISGVNGETETIIPVYDTEYLYQYPVKFTNAEQNTEIKEIHWIDKTNISPEQLPVNFVSFDTETTGTDTVNDKIIQLSAAKYRNGKLIDKYDTLVNSRRQLLPEITQITGITTEQVMTAPDFITVIPDFLKFISGEVLVGQNIIGFDLPLLLTECHNSKIEFGKYDIIDTLPLTKKAYPGRRRYAQEKLDRDFHLSEKVQEKGYVDKNILHNSLNDSFTTAELYLMDRNTLITQSKN